MDINKNYSRQLDFVKPSQLDIPIWIIGAGGIGSWTTLALSKMGCSNLVVFDFDKVEVHNTSSQFFHSSQIGKFKVNSLKNNIEQTTENEIIAISKKFEEWDIQTPPQIIINATDSLDVRRKIWNYLKLNNFPFKLYVDARMAGEFLRILTVSPLNAYSVSEYEKGLDPQKEAHEEPCTARAIVYNVFFCAGIIANCVKKYVKGESINLQVQMDLKVMQFI